MKRSRGTRAIASMTRRALISAASSASRAGRLRPASYIYGRRRQPMRFDIAKVPVGGMLIGFLLAAIIVTFVAAFAATDDDGGKGERAQASPTATPAGSPHPAGSPPHGG